MFVAGCFNLKEMYVADSQLFLQKWGWVYGSSLSSESEHVSFDGHYVVFWPTSASFLKMPDFSA